MEATILLTSPKLALGFWPLMAAWVSRKNRAYADTGLRHRQRRWVTGARGAEKQLGTAAQLY